MRALDEAPPGPHQELLDRLQRTAFLIGENAAVDEQRLMPPVALYQRSKDLEVYFEGNAGAWFAGDRYGPWLVQLRAMGVRQAVEVRARTPDPLGRVIIALDFGRNERGLDGFDPNAEIDGLEFALDHPGHARSEYVWNVLLAPNRRLVAGVVERSVLPSFSDSRVETVRSAIAGVLRIRPRGCRGGMGCITVPLSSRSMTCRPRSRGTRGWPRPSACSSPWFPRRPGDSASRRTSCGA